MFTRAISFFAPAAVMSAWATVMMHTIVSGHINRLLSPMFRDYVFMASVLLFALSALYLFLYEPAATASPAIAPTGQLRQWGRWLMLLVPVIAASILSPSALSSTTFNNRASTNGAYQMPTWTTTSSANADAIVHSDSSQPVPVDVIDLLTISRSPDQIKAFDGRKVHIIGFMEKSTLGSPRLVRWMMWCCAADAQPVSVELGGNTDGAWKDTDWLEMVGTVSFPTTLGRTVPHIDVDTVKPTTEPDEPYLSP